MIGEILGWSMMGLIFLTALLATYILVQTGRHPTAWANRVVAPAIPDEPFIVHGDDWIGF